MKKLGCLFVLLIVVGLLVVLRLNLPPAEVSAAVDPGDLEGRDVLTRVVGSIALEAMFSDEVAGWTYHDYLVVRTAKSERLGWRAIALPFGKWKVDTGE